ncbi:MAG: hypothetical protein LUC22_07305 [Prevotella sp.]|nr:hypothetical protein [Prevotella sp.]
MKTAREAENERQGRQLIGKTLGVENTWTSPYQFVVERIETDVSGVWACCTGENPANQYRHDVFLTPDALGIILAGQAYTRERFGINKQKLFSRIQIITNGNE